MAASIPSIVKEVYTAGQLLQLDDFTREQNFHIQHREFQTQQILSLGILSGLMASKTDSKNISVSAGAAIDKDGKQILLSSDKVFTITNQLDGEYQLIILDNLVAVPNYTNQLISDPSLQLISSQTPAIGSIVLANVTIASLAITTFEPVSTPAKFLPSRLPEQHSADIDASSITTGTIASDRLPNLENQNGKLTANQLPNLESLNGKLTANQLPVDIIGSKDAVLFYVNQPVAALGSGVQLSWKCDTDIDFVTLTFLSETGIQLLSTKNNDITLSQDNYSIQPFSTTVYTLTAQKQGVTIAQKQLTITIITLLEIAQKLFNNKTTASDCATQLQKQFTTATAQDTAIALATVGYSFDDTATAIKNGFNITDPTQFGQIMAKAFPNHEVPTILTIAAAQFNSNVNAANCVALLQKQFPTAVAQDAAIALAKAGYSFNDTGVAIKKGYNITDATMFGKIMAAAFPK